MLLFSRLRQALAASFTTRRRRAARLRRDLVRHYEEGRYAEATADARRLLELQKQVLGTRHSDYVTGLKTLARLLRKQGAHEEAVALDTEALSLRAAATAAPAPPPTPVLPTDPADELAALRQRFAVLGERLTTAAQGCAVGEWADDDGLVTESADCRRAFEALCDRARVWAEPRCGVSPPLASLDDVTALLAQAAAEARRVERENVRRRALDVLDQVLGLSHRASEERGTLGTCQDGARALRAAFATAPWNQLPDDADRLGEGRHPLAALLALVSGRQRLTDDDWSHHFDAVATTFGRPLAGAAARGRLAERNGGATLSSR